MIWRPGSPANNSRTPICPGETRVVRARTTVAIVGFRQAEP